MNTDGHKSGLDAITEKIIGCAFTVGNRLGCGFLEKNMRIHGAVPKLLESNRPTAGLVDQFRQTAR